MMNGHVNAMVDGDELCMKCSYNLRTLAVSGVCPECATPVTKSLALSQNAAVEDKRRLPSAAKILIFVGVSLGLEYVGGLAWPFILHHFLAYYYLLFHFRTFLERALHIGVGVLVLVATIKLVRFRRTRHIAPSIAATACLITAGLHLVLYVGVEADEWVWVHLPRHFMKLDDFSYFWNNWCYAGISCCEWVLTLGAAAALRQYALHQKNKALLVTTTLYTVLVTPIFLAWSVTGPISGRTIPWLKTRHPVTWCFHIADDAAQLYAQWEWALAAVTILYWMHVYSTLKKQRL